MLQYLFLWLEYCGLRFVSRVVQYGVASYFTFVLGGLALAFAMNCLSLVVQFALIPIVKSHSFVMLASRLLS